MSNIPNPQISDESTKNALAKLANNTTFLTFYLKLCPEDRKSFKTMLSWSSAMLSNLSNNTELIKFLLTLDQNELTSLSSMFDWSDVLISKFRDDPYHMQVLYRMWDKVADKNSFIKTYLDLCDHPNAVAVNIRDAFSNGQIDSKVWLLDTIKLLNLELGNTWTLCGWIGMLAYLMFINGPDIGISSIKSFDINPDCAELAEMLNKTLVKDNWKFKAFVCDVNSLDYNNFTWTFWSKVNNRMSHPISSIPDTIINTSCDHMGTDNAWFVNIPKSKLVILQNNDWQDNDQHNNTVRSLDEFKDRYPLSELLFSGWLDCGIYKRFMLIGRK